MRRTTSNIFTRSCGALCGEIFPTYNKSVPPSRALRSASDLASTGSGSSLFACMSMSSGTTAVPS